MPAVEGPEFRQFRGDDVGGGRRLGKSYRTARQGESARTCMVSGWNSCHFKTSNLSSFFIQSLRVSRNCIQEKSVSIAGKTAQIILETIHIVLEREAFWKFSVEI